MKKRTSFQDNRSGMTLVVVMVMTMLCTVAVSSVLFTVGARTQRSSKQVDFEKAFYIAEAGLERVAAVITTGNEVEQPYRGNIGGGSYEAKPVGRRLFGNEREIVIKSIGRFNGTECKVAMYGVRGVSWARYALWYDVANPETLVFSSKESFKGRVYSTPQMIFYNDSGPGTHFYDRVWTAAKTISKYSGANPIFDKGIVLGADKQEISEVDLSELKLVATESPSGLALIGTTTIKLNGKRMEVTNTRKGWNKKDMAIPENGIIYVGYDSANKTYTETYYDYSKKKNQTRSVRSGDIYVSAPDGMDGQLTLVSEENINITDHIKYKSNPATNPDSDDKLGLIAQKNATIKTLSPNNIDVYAHIFCKEGGFGVEDHSSRSNQGMLNVYGGIANKVRNAVGIVGGSGYSKNYIYDTRFARSPPPHYPRQPEELEWDRWEDRWEE